MRIESGTITKLHGVEELAITDFDTMQPLN